jgi:hypothetical protein
MRCPAVVSVLLLCCLLCCGASAALALPQKQHREVTLTSCKGLTSAFCEYIAAQAYNVDAFEFSDPIAHSQAGNDQSLCQAADALTVRMRELGEIVALGLSRRDAGMVGRGLGRAIHTLQDECTHHGMKNPEHAWFTLEDTCDGTQKSPDASPLAIECAAKETEVIMAEVLSAVSAAGLTSEDMDRVDEPTLHGYTRRDVCNNFLNEAQNWDGVDLQWDSDKVRPVMRKELLEAMRGTYLPLSPTPICETSDIGSTSLQPPQDLSGQDPPSCLKLDLYCLGNPNSGKGDGRLGLSSSDEEAGAIEDFQVTSQQPEVRDAGGCSVTSSQSRGLGLENALCGALLFGLMWRRRRRS